MNEKHQSEEITHLLHKSEHKNCKAFISHLSFSETRFGEIVAKFVKLLKAHNFQKQEMEIFEFPLIKKLLNALKWVS